MTATAVASATDHSAAARAAMVDSQLRTNDVIDPLLVAAVRETPREQFLPPALHAAAYIDRALPLGDGRALNPVLTTARLIGAAQLAARDHVLLIGAATGYAAALLAHGGVSVTAVEQDSRLLDIARTALADTAGVTLVKADLAAGAPDGAPYDALIVDGAIEQVPAALLAQLKPGARIVCGLIDGAVTRLARATSVDFGQSVRPLPFADLECAHLPGFAPLPPLRFLIGPA